MGASLLVLDGPDEGQRHVLDGEPMVIGRGAGCRFRLADGEASRKHASVRWDGTRYVVADLDSSNGTLLNGETLGSSRDVVLRNGDRVRIGVTTLLFSEAPKEADSRPAVGLVDLTVGDDRSRIIGKADAVRARESLAGGDDATEDLRALYRIAELAARRGPDLAETASQMLHVAVGRLGGDRGCLLLADKGTGRFRPLATRVESEGEGVAIPISRSIADYVLRHGTGVRTTDAKTDERFDGGQSIVRAGIREALCVPIEGREGPQGVVYVDTTPASIDVLEDSAGDGGPQFDDERLNWLMAVGRQVGLAVDNDRYERAIVRAERLATMGRTVAHLSHHVKNIVQGLKGGAFLIEKGLDIHDDEQIRRGWDVTSRNQARIYDLVQDMLSFSKDRTPTLAPGDLNAVVADVVELARGRMPDDAATLEVELAEPSPRAGFDEEALHRAILNVVLNALDAVESESAPAVRVRTGRSQDGGTVYVAVIDNGPGIPEGQLEAIFTPFESTKGGRGTGLGLPVTRKIMREHGGDVRAESHPGEGSRFVLTLPAADTVA